MKKILLAVVAVMMTALSVNAQVKIESPHPDLDVKIKRCTYASGTVIIDMLITNFGPDATVVFTNTSTSNRGVVVAYDDEGGAYSYDGNDELKMGISSGGLKRVFNNKFSFPQDIPLKLRVQFPKIDANASKFTMLKIPVESSGEMSISRGSAIVIRNLEWVK